MTRTTDVGALYKVRKGKVDIVDVPDLAFVAVAGRGAPDGEEFAAALQALYAVAYGAHFLAKKEYGEAPKVMPLEALWWVEDPREADLFTEVALGRASISASDRDRWRWQAMIMQPPPIDEEMGERAVEKARGKELSALDRLRFDRWEEGRCAQLLHLGPYADEGPSIARLHEAITAAGYRPRGRHHEIYLGDPRRSAPERLRTILRHPVEAA